MTVEPIIAASRRDRAEGITVHRVEDQNKNLLGWITEIFADVFYVKHADNPYRDNNRYRKIADALGALK